MEQEQEFSFGIIPLRFFQGSWQVFLVQLKSGNHWGFPKGHSQQGETPKETAFRELSEETSLFVKRMLSEISFIENYTLLRRGQQIEKRVKYFPAEVEGIFSLQGEEILDGRWLDIEEALDKITFPSSKDVCSQLQLFLNTQM